MNVYSALDLMAEEFPPTRYAVSDLIPEGLNLLVGKSKLGKSWFVLSLVIAVANGDPMLSMPTEKGDVLYCALEDSPKRLQSRMEQLLGDEKIPKNLEFTNTMRPLSNGGLTDITNWLDTHPDARLIVIDTLARVRSASRAGSSVYDQDTALLAPLQRLALERGVSILVLHHTRKASAEDVFDLINGSTGLAGVADAIVVLQRARGATEVKLSITGRDVEERELVLKFDPVSASWSSSDTARAVQIVTPERRAVLDLLENADPMPPKALAEKLKKPSGTVRKLLLGMRSASLVRRLGDGRYTVFSAVTQVTESEEAVQDEKERQPIQAVTAREQSNVVANESAEPLPLASSVTFDSNTDSFATVERATDSVTAVTPVSRQVFILHVGREREAIAFRDATPNPETRNYIDSLLQRIRNSNLPSLQRQEAQDELLLIMTSQHSQDTEVNRLSSTEASQAIS
jgi:AAA domain